MSLLDLNMIGHLIDDINKEIAYQISEHTEIPQQNITRFVTLHSSGEEHSIYLLGIKIFDSEEEAQYDPIKPEEEIELNTRENFEVFLRQLIMAELDLIAQIDISREEAE